MERRFDMTDFEQSLKDHADQFKLMPSKRVWNGIYNNLHPGSKWPSITVAIIFLITLVTIGNLNNSPKDSKNKEITAFNSGSKQTLPTSQANNANSVLQNNVATEKNKRGINSSKNKISKSRNQDKNISGTNSISENDSGEENLSAKNISSDKKNAAKNRNQIYLANNLPANNITINQTGNNASSSKILAENILSQNEKTFFAFRGSAEENLQTNELQLIFGEPFNSFQNDLLIPVSNKIFPFPASGFLSFNLKNAPVIPSENTNVLNSGKANKAVTKKHLRKKNKNIEWTFYVTPLISSASFDKKIIHPVISPDVSSIVVLPNQPQPSFELIHNARLGFETGAEMAYQFSRKFKFITGFNVNYSRYNNVSNLIHPTFTSLILTDNLGNYTKNYVTHYGNGQSQNQISLSNYNLEASIPIGLQYNIWRNEKIQIDIASAIEPSAVLKSNAFIISSDGRYYVNDPSLMRKFNLGGNFGSYITFSAQKIKWHIGPSVRYQFLSTYKNIYPGKEHFIDYGIRIGISK